MTRAPTENSFKMQSGKGGSRRTWRADQAKGTPSVPVRDTMGGERDEAEDEEKNEGKRKKEIKLQSSGSRDIIRLLRKRRQRHQISIGAQKSLKITVKKKQWANQRMSAGRSHGTRPVAGAGSGGALWRVQRMDAIIMILTHIPAPGHGIPRCSGPGTTLVFRRNISPLPGMSQFSQ